MRQTPMDISMNGTGAHPQTLGRLGSRRGLRMTMPPKPVRVMVGTLCAVICLSAIAMAAAALLVSRSPVWFLFGFEVVIAITAPMGVLFAMGRFQDGQGLALLCIAGTI